MRRALTTAAALVLLTGATGASLVFAGRTSFIVIPEGLDSSATAYAIWFSALSLASGVAVTLIGVTAKRDLRWVRAALFVILCALMLYVGGVSWFLAAGSFLDADQVVPLAWLWVFVAHLTPLSTPALALIDLIRIERARVAKRPVPKLSLALVWAIAFSVFVLPWLYY